MRVLALLVVIGCTHRAPPPAPEIIPTFSRPMPHVGRPALSLEFLLDGGPPPPLTHFAAVEPTYHVPPGWPEVCTRRGKLADDVLEYILAWCASRPGDRRALVARLDASRSSTNARLRAAAVEDLANLIADGEVEPWWNVEGELAEMVAALFVDRNRGPQAIAILERLERRDRAFPRPAPSRESLCTRALLRALARFDLETGARVLDYPDTQCGRRFEVLRCAVVRARDRPATPAGQCPAGTQLGAADAAAERLAEAYLGWQDTIPATWNAVVDAAIEAPDIPGATELAVTILEREATTCGERTGIASRAGKLQGLGFDARLAAAARGSRCEAP